MVWWRVLSASACVRACVCVGVGFDKPALDRRGRCCEILGRATVLLSCTDVRRGSSTSEFSELLQPFSRRSAPFAKQLAPTGIMARSTLSSGPLSMAEQKLERLQMRHDIAWDVLQLAVASGQGEHRRTSCAGASLGLAGTGFTTKGQLFDAYCSPCLTSQPTTLERSRLQLTDIAYCTQRGSRGRAAEDWSAARVHFFFSLPFRELRI